MSAMSTESDKPLYDTTAGKVGFSTTTIEGEASSAEEPAAKRIRYDNVGNVPLGASRILVVQNISGGQQILVEQTGNEPIEFVSSEPGGLETLAETAAAIPVSPQGETLTLVPQQIDITSATTAAPQPTFVVRSAYDTNKSVSEVTSIVNTQTIPPSDESSVVETVNEEGDEEEDVEDTHRCGKCGNEFTTLEDYIAHKLHNKKCKQRSKTVVSAANLRVSSLGQGHIDLGALLSPQHKGALRGKPRGRGRGRGLRAPGRPRLSQQNRENETPKKEGAAKYKRHTQQPSEDKLYDIDLYSCPNCDKTFRREAALNRHVEYDHIKKEDDSGDEGLELDADESQDYTVGELEVAEAEADVVEETEVQESAVPTSVSAAEKVNRPFACTICQQRFKELTILRAHWLTHTNKRAFKCTWTGCLFSFKTKGSLIRHMRRHTGDRPFKCEKCERQFAESGALTRHLKSRTPCTAKADSDLPRYGQRVDFTLPRSMYKSKGNLEPGELPGALPHQNPGSRNSLSHSIIQPGQSLLSPRVASLIGLKDGQNQVIADGKELQCRVCSSVWPDPESLTDHLKTHLSTYKYRCDICKYSTDKEADLTLHKQVTHHEPAAKSMSQELVVVSDVPAGSEQMVVEQVLEQYISQGYDLNDLADKTTATAVVDGKEVQVHIIRADSMVNQGGMTLPPDMIGGHQQVFTLRTEEIPQASTNERVDGEEEVMENMELPDSPNMEIGVPSSDAVQETSSESVPHENIELPLENSDISAAKSSTNPSNNDSADSTNVESSELEGVPEQGPGTELDTIASGDNTIKAESAPPLTEQSEPNSAVGNPSENVVTDLVEIDGKVQESNGTSIVVAADSDACTDGPTQTEADSSPPNLVQEGFQEDVNQMSPEEADDSDVRILKQQQMPDGSVTYVLEPYEDEESSKAPAVLTVSGDEVTISDDVEENVQIQNQANESDTDGGKIDGEEDADHQTRDAAIALQQLLELRDSGAGREDGSGAKVSHMCPVCNREFRGLHYLRLHMRSHTGERPHKCPECAKSFATKDTLSKHMVSHSSDRQYKCGECGKMFKRISHVREHLRIHSVDRPFTCHYCDKAFKTPNACKVHLRTHTDELPWECPHCHRLFREKGSMDRHVRIHTGVRPYKCNYCGRAFSEHGTLNRHLKAKVPCTGQLRVAREGGQLQETSSSEVPEYTEVAEVPSLLAEFSSVVADTQQYITHTEETPQEEEEPEEQQEATQYVMVTEDGQQQPIKIITDGMAADSGGLQNAEYVLLEDGNITVTMVDEAGETCVMDLQQDISSAPVTVVPDSGEVYVKGD